MQVFKADSPPQKKTLDSAELIKVYHQALLDNDYPKSI